MDPIITNALMTFGAGFTGAALSKAEGPGQVLDDVMTLVGFDRLHEVAEKKRAKRDQNIKDYKNSIATEIAKIPEDNIQEPPLSIVGPALEASKFYIEEEQLRDMFANLIASSMDKSKNSSNHASFVEIIKQMDFVDATILNFIFFQIPSKILALAKLGETTENGGSIFHYENLVGFSIQDVSTNQIASSIQNLNRLGLITIDYMSSFTEDVHYNYVEQSNEYIELSNKINNHVGQINITRGISKITPYGINFCKTCL
ncbi:DUF4393 domain-containing protein [Vagococcus fluvialis]|uniref:DUF4393 domain-containing protein n=1 Tax=Vagococcus fluvialis TaxID=2738 RepID=UPI00288E498E|nr:DUF4393 domain-containing protein [Vagococcus fluvialis]MDT2781410.1 DUF4393 domain-containing protein [Vagococcus fluvialis]